MRLPCNVNHNDVVSANVLGLSEVEIIHRTKTEFEWHRKRAHLINMHMRRPERVVLMNATHGSLTVLINSVLFVLQRPPMKGAN